MKTKFFSSALMILFLSSMVFLTECSTQTEQGKVTGFGQTMGTVQSYIKVELSDGTEVQAWLPEVDSIWDRMHNHVRYGSGDLYVEIKHNRSKDYWEYVKEIVSE